MTERPLIFLDIEGTGPDPVTDRIVQIALLNGTESRQRLVNPGCPIPVGATKIHGITDDMVKDQPLFNRIAGSLLERLAGADLAGYNLWRYDIPILWEEFHRADIAWDLAGVRVIDVYKLWMRKCPRTLTDAVREFCGREHAEAHDALADCRATADVFDNMIDRWPDISDDPAALHTLCAPSFQIDDQEIPLVDLAGTLARMPGGTMVYTQRKVRGVALADNPGYGEWMIGKDFSQNTKIILRAELDKIYAAQEFQHA